MSGARETVAKAVTLECMRGAVRQHRACFLYAFRYGIRLQLMPDLCLSGNVRMGTLLSSYRRVLLVAMFVYLQAVLEGSSCESMSALEQLLLAQCSTHMVLCETAIMLHLTSWAIVAALHA